MLHPQDQPDSPEALLQEIASESLPELADRLAQLTGDRRDQLHDALSGTLQHRVGLTLRVQRLLPDHTPAQVARDVAFLQARCPTPDPEHEDMLLQHLADPSDVTWKRIYADFLEDRGDPHVPALRAEIDAIDVGMPAKNVCGVLDAMRHLSVAYTPDQLQVLEALPFSPETLRAYKDTHVLVPGAPLSINDIRKRAGSDFCDIGWYRREPFANDQKAATRWHLLRREPVPESRGKTHDEQVALLTNGEEVPFAREVTYAAILHWLTHRERLLSDVYVRCRDKDSGGRRVYVGDFDYGGFVVVSECWDDLYNGNVGLASSVPPRKC